MDKDRLLNLLKDVDPLIKSQTQLIDYRKYHYTFKEVYALYEDKVIDIVIKYVDKEYNELLYITLASIRRYTITISKSFQKHSYVQIEEEITMANNQVDISSLFSQLQKRLYTVVDEKLHPLLSIILTPPKELTDGLNTSTRIPNVKYLEYLGIPQNDSNAKLFQKHRNNINSIIRDQIGYLDL